MTLCLCIGKEGWATLLSVYAPTMTNTEQTITEFYKQLHSMISNVPYHDKLILLGDFNARELVVTMKFGYLYLDTLV